MDKWYVYQNEQTLGPYTRDELRKMAKKKNISKKDLVSQEGSNEWVRANSVKKVFKSPLRRILSFLVLLILLGVVLFAGVTFVNSRDSKNVIIAKGVSQLRDAVQPSENKTLEITDSNSSVKGLKLEVLQGSYEGKTDFEIITSEIDEHKFGPSFQPITPIISIKNGGEYAKEVMTLTIPIALPEGYFASAFYYDRKTGKLEGIPTYELEKNKIVIKTLHFSDLVVSIIDINEVSGDVIIDTNFLPGVDDWQFTNYGSSIATGGHCAGQAISAMYYYLEKRLVLGERALYGRYDNNDRGYGTIDFPWDDSWGYRLASSVQKDINWQTNTFKIMKELGGIENNLTMMSFAHAMLLTGEPQFVGLSKTYESGGHAIIAYKLDKNGLYVADPNFPGEERLIPYSGGVLGPYYSAENAEQIESGEAKAYDIVAYLAKTSMIPWSQVGARFTELDKKSVGNDLFKNYTIEVREIDEKGRESWVPLVDNFETSTEKTARVTIQTANGVVHLEDKLHIRMTPQATDLAIQLVEGTDIVKGAYADSSEPFIIDLVEGVKEIGLLAVQEIGEDFFYVDMQRYNIINNEVDITGAYEGMFVVEEAGPAVEFLINRLVKFFANILNTEADRVESGSLGNALDFIEFTEVPFQMTISNYDKKSGDCDIRIYVIEEDGTEFVVDTTGEFSKNQLKFKFVHYDGSKMDMLGAFNGNTFAGKFNVTAWGIVKNALIGSWSVSK